MTRRLEWNSINHIDYVRRLCSSKDAVGLYIYFKVVKSLDRCCCLLSAGVPVLCSSVFRSAEIIIIFIDRGQDVLNRRSDRGGYFLSVIRISSAHISIIDI